ncbi:MAG: hypothetical protein ACPG1A_08650 [Halioglobus sp.]
MNTRRIWLLWLVPSFRYGKLLTGIVLFCIFLPLFYTGVNDRPDDSTPALFFSSVLAYIIPMFSHITGRTKNALEELRPRLDIDESEYERATTWLEWAPAWVVALQLGSGALLGCIHMAFVHGSASLMVNEAMGSASDALSLLGAVMVWMVMTSVISMLIQQAIIFARLGRNNARLTLLNPASLAPFARVSISASLAIIGALAMFPLIGLEGAMDMMEILPGAMATLPALICLFFIPIWPVHRRLAAMKHEQLQDINRQVEEQLAATGENPASDSLAQLGPLLTYRREVQDAPTWLFDGDNVSRLLLYLVIPPLTWIAAALMENLVDSLL